MCPIITAVCPVAKDHRFRMFNAILLRNISAKGLGLRCKAPSPFGPARYTLLPLGHFPVQVAMSWGPECLQASASSCATWVPFSREYPSSALGGFQQPGSSPLLSGTPQSLSCRLLSHSPAPAALPCHTPLYVKEDNDLGLGGAC